jgi:hypothetical protein
MRLLIAAVTMFLFLSSSQEFYELCKLPLLIEHYKKHKMDNGSLSLVDFLKTHYTKETKNDNDDNEDNELPFKNIFDNHLSQFYLPVNEVHFASNKANCTSTANWRYSDWKSYDLIFPVFHPPCIS